MSSSSYTVTYLDDYQAQADDQIWPEAYSYDVIVVLFRIGSLIG